MGMKTKDHCPRCQQVTEQAIISRPGYNLIYCLICKFLVDIIYSDEGGGD